MDDLSAFALELLKLAFVASLSAYVMHWLTARRFLSERQWETKFEHYNRMNQLMAKARGFVARDILSGGVEITDRRTKQPAVEELVDAIMVADLVLSENARKPCVQFIKEGVRSLDLNEAEDWRECVKGMRDLHKAFLLAARRDLQLDDTSTLTARLRRLFGRSKSSPYWLDSDPTDPPV